MQQRERSGALNICTAVTRHEVSRDRKHHRAFDAAARFLEGRRRLKRCSSPKGRSAHERPNIANALSDSSSGRASGATARPIAARTRLLLEGAILPTLLRLSAPNILNLPAIVGMITFDGLFVGRLGADALAEVSLAFPFVMLIQYALGMALYFATQGFGSVLWTVAANVVRLPANTGCAAAAIHWRDLGALGFFAAVAIGFCAYAALTSAALVAVKTPAAGGAGRRQGRHDSRPRFEAQDRRLVVSGFRSGHKQPIEGRDPDRCRRARRAGDLHHRRVAIGVRLGIDGNTVGARRVNAPMGGIVPKVVDARDTTEFRNLSA